MGFIYAEYIIKVSLQRYYWGDQRPELCNEPKRSTEPQGNNSSTFGCPFFPGIKPTSPEPGSSVFFSIEALWKVPQRSPVAGFVREISLKVLLCWEGISRELFQVLLFGTSFAKDQERKRERNPVTPPFIEKFGGRTQRNSARVWKPLLSLWRT